MSVKRGIVLGHEIYRAGTEVDKAKVGMIAKSLSQNTLKTSDLF